MAACGKLNKCTSIGAVLGKIRSGLVGQAAILGLLAVIAGVALGIIAFHSLGNRLVNSVLNGQANDPAVTPMPSSTVASCPATTPIVAPNLVPGRELYFLIDRSYSYRRFTQWALDTIKHALETTLSPDDRLTAAWIGQNSADPSDTFCCDLPVPQIDVPVLPPVPDQPVTKPTLPPDPSLSSMGAVQRELQNDSIIADNNRATQTYNCAMKNRNDRAAQELQSWSENQTEAIHAYWQTIEPKFSVEQFDAVTHIRESLYRAALVLNDDEKRKTRFLVIASDMQETYAPNFTSVHPDLTGVTVIVLYRCTEAEACESLKGYWSNQFAQMGATTTIYLQETYPEEKLISLLTKEMTR